MKYRRQSGIFHFEENTFQTSVQCFAKNLHQVLLNNDISSIETAN